MSIHKVSSIPNVYKLEKFVIIDTLDTFGVSPLEVTKPNLLHCYKVYVDVEYDGGGEVVKTEKINVSEEPICVAVPLSLWQQGSKEGLDNAGNSLICPPYIASKMGNIKSDATLSENILGNLVHRSSVIYAQRRDYGVDVYTGNKNHDRQGEVSDDLLNKTKYVDINADGRSLKISSQTDKSNNVALTTDQFAPRHGGPPEGTLTNYFTDIDSLTHIESLQKACIINEDAAIDYLLDIDKVTRTGITTITTGNKYELQATDTQTSSSDTNIGFKLVTASAGGGSAGTFTELTDTDTPSSSTYTNTPFAIVHLSEDDGDETNPVVESVKMSYLNSKHFRGNGNVATLLTNNQTMKFAVSSIPTVSTSDDSKFSCESSASPCASDGVVLRDMSEIVASAVSAKKVAGNESGAGIGDLYFLVASATESKFHQLQYASQLQHVTTSVPVNEEGDAIETVASLTPDGDYGQFKIDFKAMSDLLLEGDDVVGGGSNAIGTYFVVKKGTGANAGKLEGAKIGDEAFSGGGGGNVKYVGALENAPGSLKFKDIVGNYNDDIKHLNYTPTLFGICKENGSYEYRYFLTSAKVEAT